MLLSLRYLLPFLLAAGRLVYSAPTAGCTNCTLHTGVDPLHTLVERDPPPVPVDFVLEPFSGTTTTKVAFIREPAGAGWNKDTADLYAEAAYRKLGVPFNLAAAMLNPKDGIYIGTILRGDASIAAFDVGLTPALQAATEGNGYKDEDGFGALVHAEIVAAYWMEYSLFFEEENSVSFAASEKYPVGTTVSVFGRRTAKDADPGFVPPCSIGTKLKISCATVLTSLGVGFGVDGP